MSVRSRPVRLPTAARGKFPFLPPFPFFYPTFGFLPRPPFFYPALRFFTINNFPSRSWVIKSFIDLYHLLIPFQFLNNFPSHPGYYYVFYHYNQHNKRLYYCLDKLVLDQIGQY